MPSSSRTHRSSVESRVRPAADIQLRSSDVPAAGRASIFDFGCAATASPVQLHAFDHAIQCLHTNIQALSGALGEGPSVQRAAAAGIASGGGKTPHLGALQRAFGRHDLGGVQAHVGGAAKGAAEAMGAEAYATGDHVAFRQSPDLHTAAHEAAHVVQQRAGVQLAGGVGKVGDTYERHADEVADAVVQGKNAEGILDRMAGGSGGGGVQKSAVQLQALSVPDKAHAAKIDTALRAHAGKCKATVVAANLETLITRINSAVMAYLGAHPGLGNHLAALVDRVLETPVKGQRDPAKAAFTQLNGVRSIVDQANTQFATQKGMTCGVEVAKSFLQQVNPAMFLVALGESVSDHGVTGIDSYNKAGDRAIADRAGNTTLGEKMIGADPLAHFEKHGMNTNVFNYFVSQVTSRQVKPLPSLVGRFTPQQVTAIQGLLSPGAFVMLDVTTESGRRHKLMAFNKGGAKVYNPSIGSPIALTYVNVVRPPELGGATYDTCLEAGVVKL